MGVDGGGVDGMDLCSSVLCFIIELFPLSFLLKLCGSVGRGRGH